MSRVYFIKPIGMDGPVKIGCAQIAADRVHQLAAWSPFDLEMVASMRGDKELEERFHAYFIDDHHRQEWFHSSDRMKEVIEAVREGSFDTSVLPPSLGPIRIAARMRGKDSPEEWEYRKKYAALSNAKRWQSGRWPAAPCVFKQFSAARRADEMARIDGLLAQKHRRLEWEQFIPPGEGRAA